MISDLPAGVRDQRTLYVFPCSDRKYVFPTQDLPREMTDTMPDLAVGYLAIRC